MIKVRKNQDNHYVLYDVFCKSNGITTQDIVDRCNQDLIKEVSEKYDSLERIIIEGTYLHIECSLSPLRFDDDMFNDCVYLYENQIVSYYYCWKKLSNDKTPFKYGHTYHEKFGLGFGDHILYAEENDIKQRPNKLFFYLENGISGDYDIRFKNGIQMRFTIKDDGEVVSKDICLMKESFNSKSIISRVVLLRSFISLGLYPSKNKIVHKLMRNVLAVVEQILKEKALENKDD